MPSAYKDRLLPRLQVFSLLSGIQTDLSTLRISTEGLTCSVEDRLNIVRSEGDFSPRSNCPMYVR